MKAGEVATCLQGPGLREPAKGHATLRAIGALIPEPGLVARWLPQLARQVMASCEPDRALNNWERFFRSIESPADFLLRLESAPQMLPALTTLFASSQYLTDMVQQSPDIVARLGQAQHLSTPRTQEAMAQDLRAALEQPGAHGLSPALEDQFRLLRRFKKREVVRIGLRDLLRQADLVETTEDLANLADVCLAGAYESCLRELTARYGEPRGLDAAGVTRPSEFTILGLGKLGGQELNFSSDIDLLFLYTADGETTGVAGPDGRVSNQITTHEFFLRLARLLLRAIHDITEEGNVFRVDLRLRPDGRGGPLVNSLHALETYYQYWGKTWERQMLLKARVAAGSEKLGREFFHMIHPFIFRKYLDAGALQEIKQIKEQIDRSQEQRRTRRINIKLGWGGIRE
ncbi:MAG: bifunctional [glutamate--ammonia ligase]-adenylyl-L-tyrosine phosphorylase/[glutamate--ammonia-ligase] adenylyltransferase, partial [Candidatus Entotheonellia bacterium]